MGRTPLTLLINALTGKVRTSRISLARTVVERSRIPTYGLPMTKRREVEPIRRAHLGTSWWEADPHQFSEEINRCCSEGFKTVEKLLKTILEEEEAGEYDLAPNL